MVKKICLLFFLAFALFSCNTSKKIIYFQGLNPNDTIVGKSKRGYEIKIKADDVLAITVSSADYLAQEAARPFNRSYSAVTAADAGGAKSLNGSNAQSSDSAVSPTYQVSEDGKIIFPVLGELSVAGMSKVELIKMLSDKIKVYINNPVVSVRLVNFKVTVLGEVLTPGEFEVTSERFTLPQAIAKAGDLTIYGVREEILLVREDNGVKSYHYLDITKADFINSPYYYLQQNDLIYIKPNRSKSATSLIGNNFGVIVSSLSVLIAVTTLLIRN